MLATMTLLTMSWLFPSCEKETFDISQTMEAYYIESTRLLIVPADSVQSFSNKVNVFTRTYPLALEHEKYPAIKENIRAASIRFTIKIDTTWAGIDSINF